MGLVDYSDSESEGEEGAAPAPAPIPTTSLGKKAFPDKMVDRANPGKGKILVSLPSSASSADPSPATDGDGEEGRPAKRARTGGSSRFSGFSSFLPAPKKTTTIAAPSAARSKGNEGDDGKMAPPRPGVHLNLKTSGEAAFSRDAADGGGVEGGSGLKLPPPRAAAATPSIPEGQKPADEVQLVGKPLMFRPLSVSRKPGKKNKGPASARPAVAKTVSATLPPAAAAAAAATQLAPSPKKKVSLFSIGDDEAPSTEAAPATTGAYEPLFSHAEASAVPDEGEDGVTGNYDQYAASYDAGPRQALAQPESLDSIADGLNLSAAARRELFGRGGRAVGMADAATAAARVVNFNMDREYAHNEAVRASGDTVQHNPVRGIMPGKHSLRQLVSAVQTQRDALEENFAKNRATQKESSGRYGWR